MFIELLVLLSGSVAAGFLIGTAQHFVSFGVWGYGFGRGAFNLARLEGGAVGAALGIPTGLVAYYFIFRRHVTAKQAAVVVSASLVSGCALGIALFWVSAFVTPILTIGVAFWVGRHTPASEPPTFLP